MKPNSSSAIRVLFAVVSVVLLYCIRPQLTNDIHYIPYNATALKLRPVKITEKIPRIIHQTYKVANESYFSNHWRSAYSAMKVINKNYTLMLWSDEAIVEFLNSTYSWFMPTFHSYAYPIQKVDAFRYFALHHYGGIYADLDIVPLKPFDILLQYDVVLPKTHPMGFSNDLIASVPNHPFFTQLINALPGANSRIYVLPYFIVFFSGGPLFLTRQYHKAQPHVVKNVMVMNDDMYTDREGLVTHTEGNSWHTKDAQLFSYLWYRQRKNLMCAIWLTCVLMPLMIILLVSKSLRKFIYSATEEIWSKARRMFYQLIYYRRVSPNLV